MSDSGQSAISATPLAFRRILLAASQGQPSAVLWFAAALAHFHGAELIAAHVMAFEDFEKLDESQRKVEQARLERELRDAAGPEANAVPVHVLLQGGDPAETIPALAGRYAADLVVTGHEGRHGVQKLLAPSRDQAIASTGACPVLLVGTEITAPAPGGLQIRRILHPTDFNPQSRVSMEMAYALAARHGAALSLLHVADNIWKEPLSTRLSPEAFCRMRLIEAGLPEQHAGIEPEFLVEFGSPEDLVLEIARRLAVDLIVMGVPQLPHPGLASHLPGPLAYNIASHASCPVLALPHAPEKEPMETRP